jgi:ribosome-binding factor A
MSKGPSERNARVEGELRSVLSDLLRSEVNDPRLEGASVSGVHLNADRTHARVYFSVLTGDADDATVKEGFAAAGAFLRRELGRRMRLRTVPTLEFDRDTSYEYGDRMERLFARLRAEGKMTTGDGSGDAE